MIVFVILHYKTIEDTLSCINSIKKLSHKSKIVVVDNASGNDDDIDRIKKEDVDLLVSDMNLGFANGNNLGCRYAIDKYNPKYLCVINSDTVIEQPNFIEVIYDLYKKYKFDVLGPKILPDNLDSCNPFNAYEEYEDIDLAINNANKKLYIYSRPILRSIYDRARCIKSHLVKRIPLKNGESEQTGVSLHGCALIFSRKYFQRYNDVFYRETFMFHEEEFLTYRMRKDHLLFLYSPSLEIYHNEGSSQNKEYKKNWEKEIFKNKNIIKSLELLKKIKREGRSI